MTRQQPGSVPSPTPDGAPETTGDTTRRRANTRARLLSAAVDVFAEKGLHGATVDDLVAAAGYTRGAFYSNFASKEELFYALFEAESHQMVQLVREEVEASSGALDLGVVGAVLERLHPHARTWYLLQTEYLLHAMRDPAAGRRYLEQSAHFDEEFADVLERALVRLGRRPTVPIAQVTNALSALYLRRLAVETLQDTAATTTSENAESAAGSASEPAEPGFLEQLLPAILLGLSEPTP